MMSRGRTDKSRKKRKGPSDRPFLYNQHERVAKGAGERGAQVYIKNVLMQVGIWLCKRKARGTQVYLNQHFKSIHLKSIPPGISLLSPPFSY